MKKIFISALLLGAFVVPSLTFAEVSEERRAEIANMVTTVLGNPEETRDIDHALDNVKVYSPERDNRHTLHDKSFEEAMVSADTYEIGNDEEPEEEYGVAQADVVESEDEE